MMTEDTSLHELNMVKVTEGWIRLCMIPTFCFVSKLTHWNPSMETKDVEKRKAGRFKSGPWQRQYIQDSGCFCLFEKRKNVLDKSLNKQHHRESPSTPVHLSSLVLAYFSPCIF